LHLAVPRRIRFPLHLHNLSELVESEVHTDRFDLAATVHGFKNGIDLEASVLAG
jgi:hypothetical protein